MKRFVAHASRAFALLLAVSASTAWSNDWRIETGPAWKVEGKIEGPMDVSGLACLTSGEGFLVSDETRVAQRFHLDRAAKTIVVGQPVNLLPGKGKELDLEGIALSSDGKRFYAAGSHGVSRKSGAVKPDRSHVFRFAADPTNALVAVTTLVPVIESDAIFRDSLGKPSKQSGLDIEGIAELGGTLFFGVRSPSVNGHSFIIEVKADDLFANASKATHRKHDLALGQGQGIRDLVRVSDGFLLIAGSAPNDPADASFTLYHWQGPDGRLTRIGNVPKVKGKAEGLLALDESTDKLTVLVAFDGALNGGLLELTLFKPHN